MHIRTLTGLYIICFLFAGAFLADAKPPPEWNNPGAGRIDSKTIKFGYRADCAPATSETDMAINNVRARLLGGLL